MDNAEFKVFLVPLAKSHFHIAFQDDDFKAVDPESGALIPLPWIPLEPSHACLDLQRHWIFPQPLDGSVASVRVPPMCLGLLILSSSNPWEKQRSFNSLGPTFVYPVMVWTSYLSK